MHIGNQLIAPNGYGELRNDIRYHLLRNDAQCGRVFLASFLTEKPGATLTVLSCAAFEDGLAARAIVRCDLALHMPPWLAPLQGLDLRAIDAKRYRARRSHLDVSEQRRAHLQDALTHLNEIFSAEDPLRAINRFAREAVPSQNESRFRVWFLVYLVFGHNSLTLWPLVYRYGQWVREEKPSVKFGRPSRFGAAHGYPCTADMKQMIEIGYLRFADLGRSMWKVYALAMTKVFGCDVITLDGGDKAYVHPSGAPFPSRHQWSYWCIKIFGLPHIQKTLYGEQRHRSGQASIGRFSQAVANLMEKVEADAYSTLEYPRGFTDDHLLPKLYVVRIVCVLSGVVVGIGFSLGSETHLAYAMALFCCAIGKQKFCALFGIEIDEDRWSCIGLSTAFIPDRGPGASARIANQLRGVTAERELPPSHTPQSHGTVESSHPRDPHIEGRPTHVPSDMNPVELARREIHQLLSDNNNSSALERMTPEMLRDDVLATPMGIWRYLDDRGRNDAQGMAFDDAVRTFLTPVDFVVVDGRLSLQKMPYNSPALRSTGILDKLRHHGATRLPGYAMELCVRHAWVVVNNRLVEVDAQLPIRDDEGQLFVSLDELKAYADAKRKGRNRVDDNRAPTLSEAMQESDQATGKSWYGGKRRSGKAKTRTPAARREVQHVKRGKGRGA
jgi:hypothetical protein